MVVWWEVVRLLLQVSVAGGSILVPESGFGSVLGFSLQLSIAVPDVLLLLLPLSGVRRRVGLVSFLLGSTLYGS